MLFSPRLRHVNFPRQAAARRLVDYAQPVVVPARGVDEVRLAEDESAFVDWLFKRAGLDASHYRGETLSRRLAACLRVLRVSSLTAARCAIEQEPQQLAGAMSAMLVGATSFFRDAETFQYLATNVLPAMVARNSISYVWSAGCSDGAELYSIAMLLAEAEALSRSYLLGTDCRTEAIDRAKRGRFTATETASVPLDYQARYFTVDGNGVRVSRDIAAPLRWRAADVLAVREHGLWDMILFRNAAIYMRTQSTAPLWGQLEASLRVGGILVLGRAERPTGTARLVQCGPCVYRKIRR